ncbi:hypothetical protein EJ08DRAFT_694628 [Tothia fuscella]|uniref:Uncharacterized protein n=1 Tax=Tothia fuscella TaxID=1048955 RepID=A0A9P4NY88_9PEZI|nr:hypothetical protein EJ08DRAFT_694628 [Tothia fuscella]
MKSPKNTASTPSALRLRGAFLDLPREIRDMIYQLYAGHKPAILIGPTHGRIVAADKYIETKPRKIYPHSLTLTNRQIQIEYLDHFTKYATFYYIDADWNKSLLASHQHLSTPYTTHPNLCYPICTTLLEHLVVAGRQRGTHDSRY